MYDTFLPGNWIDTIDVNDFVNLNKKPFLENPFFLPEENAFQNFKNSLEFYISQDTVIRFEESLFPLKEILEILDQLQLKEKKFLFPFSDDKTFEELFNETSSLGLKNAIKTDLLERSIGNTVPPLFFPDIRQLPLYGTKRIIDEKKKKLKQTDNEYQTGDWIEKRIEINRQIELLKVFNNQLPTSMKKPAKDSIDVFNSFLNIILYAIKENPYVTFHLPSLIHFIDIYLEKDIQRKKIDEIEASLLVGEFYTKLLFIHHYFRRKQINFLTIETIFSTEPSKTTYRFLSFYKSLGNLSFPLLVVSHFDTPQPLRSEYDYLIKRKFPVRFPHSRLFEKGQSYNLSHLGFPYKSDEDVILFNKPCDLIKLLFITINGGKDIEKNHNVFPVYQKFLDDDINFDYFMEQFKDVISVVFTIYSEANNLVMYLTEKYFSHSFRNGFKSFYNYYYYYLNFIRIDELAIYLLAIQSKKILLDRNTKGYVTGIKVNDEFSNEEISNMIQKVSFLFQDEVNKIPFYQFGKPKLNFFLSENLQSRNSYPFALLPPEHLPVKFIVTNKARFRTYQDILSMSDFNILDIQI